MKRDFWIKLENWKSSDVKKPLMVVGARQTGKTYIIDKFCKENYKKYCYTNLFKDKKIIEIFNEYSNFKDRIEFLQQYFNIDLNDKDTILFVDEIQECDDFIEALKLFCEEGYNNIIVAGSLLGIKLKRFKKSYPVGKVYEEILYPMNFREFLIAIGKENYIESIKKSFLNDSKCIFHEELINLYKRYIFLGGMPELINDYVSNNQDLSKVNTNLYANNIIKAYKEDIANYNEDPKEVIRIQNIYDNIAPQLMKENPKFMYAKFDKKNRKSDYITALDWLTSSKLVHKCNQLNSPNYPIKLYSNSDNYKLFLSDVGLLRALIGVDIDNIFLDGDFPYKGMLAENYVAEELVNQFEDIYYWSRKGNENNNHTEVDFVIQIGSNIIPIEVKSGEHTKSKSLEEYDREFNPSLIIRISAKNFGKEGNIKSIPLYATFLIKELLLEKN